MGRRRPPCFASRVRVRLAAGNRVRPDGERQGRRTSSGGSDFRRERRRTTVVWRRGGESTATGGSRCDEPRHGMKKLLEATE
jgi:hypothetical protein